MKFLKSFYLILTWQTALIATLSIVSTLLCRHYNILAEFPLTLVGIAVVFPLVFSINSAYKRREDALNQYANLKANGRAIFFASRDWLENSDKIKLAELKKEIAYLFNTLNLFFHSVGSENEIEEKHVYESFRKLSGAIQNFREQGMNSSEISRVNQYLSKMFIAFEQMKHIYQYRTPLTLRAYSKVFISITPIIYAPFFAHVTIDYSIYFSAVLPIFFSIILISLDNIQEHLENPFDKIGEDDIHINSDKFIESLDY